MMLLLSCHARLLFALEVFPGYGRAIIARANAFAADLAPVHQGSAYPALRALEAAGLVVATEGPQRPAEAGGRPRKYYRITGKGIAQLDAWRPVLAALAGTSEPWAAFLAARVRVLRQLRAEGHADDRIAVTCSMAAADVAGILAACGELAS